jgi:large subunit ribosomal protein L35
LLLTAWNWFTVIFVLLVPAAAFVQGFRAYTRSLRNDGSRTPTPNPKTATPTMPKMKSHSGARKRFKKTSNGKVKRRQTKRRHILTKKSPKKKRQLRKAPLVDETDRDRVKRMLG